MEKFNNNEPIYIQVMNIIRHQIVSGELKENDKVKSVRELALLFGVNPNTVQKSLTELEKEGLIRTERTNGRFVCVSKQQVDKEKRKLAVSKTQEYLAWMRKMSFQEEEMKEFLRSEWKGEDNHK
ncbi:MAG: GntR family transcriptional regulator [Erysipelotrichaceae bacterium]|nr:GntR family transcriptional regulator [Erysipelotrichaceae bacterium]